MPRFDVVEDDRRELLHLEALRIDRRISSMSATT